MKVLKNWRLILLIVALLLVAMQQRRVISLKKEAEIHKHNTEVLLQDVERYKLHDSLNVAKVEALHLKISDFEKYRAEDAVLIDDLTKRNEDLHSLATARLKTISKIEGIAQDTMYIVERDSVLIDQPAKIMKYKDEWINLECKIINDKFVANIVNVERLVLTNVVKYSRALGFLWKTKKIKEQSYSIISRNPRTTVEEFEVIVIEN